MNLQILRYAQNDGCDKTAPMLDISSLNPPQQSAVVNYEGPTLILAGAGTGKTRAITYRIAYMLENSVPPATIAAMTFTNKAAREMRDRLKELSGEKATKVSLGTFHAFCLKLLRKYHHRINLPAKFTLVSAGEQVDLVRRALDEKCWHGIYNAASVHAAISAAKNILLEPNDIITDESFKFNAQIEREALAEVYSLYERQLRLNHAIDFDDCIFKLVKLLRTEKDILETLQLQYQYILVDEFQDTNISQFAVLELIASKNKNICVVGDDDQSIYSWRGAVPQILAKFESTFEGTRVIFLEQNYRCTNIILGAANRVIKNNSSRKDKSLWSEASDQIPITLMVHKDEKFESEWVAETCLTLLGRGLQPKDIAVLYRANTQSKFIELAMREMRVPYKTYGGQSFFERKEIKDFLAYLRLIAYHDDAMAFWRIINTPSRGLGLKTLEKIEAIAAAEKKSPYHIISSGKGDLIGRPATAAAEFVEKIKHFAERQVHDLAQFEAFARDMIREFHLADDIRAKTRDEISKRNKLDTLHNIPNYLKYSIERQLQGQTTVDFKELIDRLTLNETEEFGADEEKPNCVSLMTVHAAKGLEFSAVFSVGLEEDLFPHKNSLTSTIGLEEERRLFYVALTRAKKNLFLSHTMERSTAYHKEFRKPSRFLKELGDALNMEMQENFAQDAETRKQSRKTNTLARLGEIKDRLSQFKS